MKINWDTEPALIIGATKALLEVAAGAGLVVSDHTTSAIVAGVTAVVTLLATFFARSQVTSPATAQALADKANAPVPLPPGFGGNGAAGYGDPAAEAVLRGDPVKVRRIPSTDPRLGRHVRHDPRSRAFAIPELPSGDIKSVAWTQQLPCFDQGQLGSCTGNAAAGWIVTDDESYRGLNVGLDGKPISENTAVALYSAATKLDDIHGTYPPTDTGSDGLSVAKALKNAGYCSGYSHAFTIQALYSALQVGPVMCGSDWYNSMFDPDPDGRIHIDTDTGIAGGHEYVVYRLDVTDGTPIRLWMRNSWGTSWGVNGCGWFDPAEYAKLLADDGDVTQPMPIAIAPTPDPVPPPAPTPVGDPFLQACQTYPGLTAWLARNSKRHHVNGQTMSEYQYAVWNLAREAKLRR